MSAPSALTVVYPPCFQNSFWSYPSYRKGAQSLYSKLQCGLDENQSILAFVAHRAELEYTHAEALATPPPSASLSAPLFKQAAAALVGGLPDSANGTRGFASNSSATSHAFRLIEAEAATSHANAHGKTARMLEQTVLEPFGKWALEHHERVTDSWQHVDGTLKAFERQKAEVDKLKSHYESKCRAADEAHDDARFAPVEEASPLSSPPLLKPPTQQIKQRTISGDSSRSIDLHSGSTEDTSDPETLKRRETLRKQFGFSQRATSGQHRDQSLQAFAGVKLPPLPTETEGESLEPRLPASNLKRSGTISALVHSAVEKIPAPLKAAVGGVVAGSDPRHIRLRRDADNAERVYEEAVRSLDRTRCQVEEVLFQHYGLTQRWEVDRIRAVHSVLASYNKAIAAQLPALDESVNRGFQLHHGLSSSLELRAMIREARTGPFQPAIERFVPYYHEDIPTTGLATNGGFGIDLALVERLEILNQSQLGTAATLPPVLEALLAALDRSYADAERWAVPKPEDSDVEVEDEKLIQGQEKRKTWVLEVPITVTHRLRDALIAQLHPSAADTIYGDKTVTSNSAVPAKMLDAYDPPVLAACIKLWLLELQQSLITEDLWDSIDTIYRAAAGQEREALSQSSAANETADDDDDDQPVDSTPSKQKRLPRVQMDAATEEKIRLGVLEDLRVVLGKLPKIHLVCLDAIIAHLHRLVSSTESTEPSTVYLNKLGLALGRAVLRPPVETRYTLSVPNSTLVVMDLIAHYNELFPSLMEKKRTEKATIGRGVPLRKRTKPIDQRISRSSIGSDLQEGAKKLMQQMDERGPHPTTKDAETPAAIASPPPTITTSNLNVQEEKEADDTAAPTPLMERVLSSSKTDVEADRNDESPPKEAETMPISDENDQDRPLSNVARLSRQFNSANLGSKADLTGASRVRVNSSNDTSSSSGGVPRGPRPAGARAARASGQYSSISSTRNES